MNLKLKTLGQLRRLVANKIDRARRSHWSLGQIAIRQPIDLYYWGGKPVAFMKRSECIKILNG